MNNNYKIIYKIMYVMKLLCIKKKQIMKTVTISFINYNQYLQILELKIQ